MRRVLAVLVTLGLMLMLTVLLPQTATAAVGSPGCGNPMPAGTTTQTIMVNGVQNSYLQIIPTGLSPTVPVPIVMGFHGGGGTAQNANAYMGLTSNAPAIYVYPQAPYWPEAGGVGWDVSPSGKNFPFIDALLTKLKNTYCVDPTRVFAAGKSNGGFFANSLLCLRPNSFKAAASVAGGGPQYNCSAARAFWGVHGTADTAVPISTGRWSRTYWLAANQYKNVPPVPISPAPCVSHPGTLNPVIWCEHSGGHIWPSWAGGAIRNWFLSL